MNLLIGLPGDRPGGLLLSIIYFLASGLAALSLGMAYAVVGALWPRVSLPLQAASAVLRGVPLLLLVFLFAHVPPLTTTFAGFIALSLYSFSHVGEVLRSFLVAYPRAAADQARLMGMSLTRDWLTLRVPWTLWRSWAALMTHWVSLLKDTGALVVLGIGELTTVAKILSEVMPGLHDWILVLLLSAALYLAATLAMIWSLPRVAGWALRILSVTEQQRRFQGFERFA